MVFSSHLFIFYFLPLALGAYYLVPRQLRHLVLTLFSYLFYGWSNPAFMLLMLVSTAIDYFCGLIIVSPTPWRPASLVPLAPGPRGPRQKLALWTSICANLGLLAFFKYGNFGIDAYNDLMVGLGFDSAVWDHFWRITLPLGISFYTFQSMSYSIDIYRGEATPLRNPVDFACYVAMFPQLVAGPIIRYHEVARQMRERSHTLERFARGVAFFALGMAKKVLLANPCGKIADTVFDAGARGLLDSWYGAFAYGFQIYFDFSGYSDMAVGLGLMLGFVFPKNFDSPYHSRSITEFWQRWHLSLSFFLRDYLYIPLGGNRKGQARTYANLAIVMLLGGLWHGASWNFVVWGGIHGGVLALERALAPRRWLERLPAALRVALTFTITTIAWVFFRAADLPAALDFLGAMFAIKATDPRADLLAGLLYQPYYLLAFALAAAVIWGCRDSWHFTRVLTPLRAACCLALLLLALAALTTQSYNPFIYFIF